MLVLLACAFSVREAFFGCQVSWLNFEFLMIRNERGSIWHQ